MSPGASPILTVLLPAVLAELPHLCLPHIPLSRMYLLRQTRVCSAQGEETIFLALAIKGKCTCGHTDRESVCLPAEGDTGLRPTLSLVSHEYLERMICLLKEKHQNCSGRCQRARARDVQYPGSWPHYSSPTFPSPLFMWNELPQLLCSGHVNGKLPFNTPYHPLLMSPRPRLRSHARTRTNEPPAWGIKESPDGGCSHLEH